MTDDWEFICTLANDCKKAMIAAGLECQTQGYMVSGIVDVWVIRQDKRIGIVRIQFDKISTQVIKDPSEWEGTGDIGWAVPRYCGFDISDPSWDPTQTITTVVANMLEQIGEAGYEIDMPNNMGH
jgi:hypothetical protein